MSQTRVLKTEIIATAESLLPAAWGGGVQLEVEETFEDVTTTVIRCRVTNANGEAPAGIAVKHVRPHPENPMGYLHSFLNDWAACVFLNSFEHDPPLAPRFYGGDSKFCVLVMEDLGSGDGPDTMELLDGSDPDPAAQALIEQAALIGQLHAATINRADDYLKLRKALGPLQPSSKLFNYPWSNALRQPPASSEISKAIERYRAVRERLGLSPASGADAEIEAVASMVEGDAGPFLAYCKGDQNLPAEVIRSRGQLRLFDYGEGGYRHALIEGMPGRFTWGCMMRLPPELIPAMEVAYRGELISGCREAADDSMWSRAMADAGARWHIFHALTRVPTALDEDYQRGPTTLRQQVTAWVDAFAELAEQTDYYPALGHSAREMSSRLRSLWRPEETALPYYPAFNS